MESKRCNGYATALPHEAVVFRTQPRSKASIRVGRISPRPAGDVTLTRYETSSQKVRDPCLRSDRLPQAIDDLPAAIRRKPKPMAVAALSVGARGGREDSEKHPGLLDAAEHLAPSSRKLHIAVSGPDLGLELRGERRHQPRGIESDSPDIFEERQAYASHWHVQSSSRSTITQSRHCPSSLP